MCKGKEEREKRCVFVKEYKGWKGVKKGRRERRQGWERIVRDQEWGG